MVKAWEKAGGLEKWQSIDTLSFQKRSILYLEDGSVESDVDQRQTFVFDPILQISLAWNSDSIDRYHAFDGQTSQLREGEEEGEQVDGMAPALASAYYTMSMPYKLVDDAELLEYVGEQVIMGDTLQTIQVNYHLEDPANDIWWYYFQQDGSFWGSKVFHTPTYALITHVSMDRSISLTMQGHRKSYRVDSLNQIKFLRAEFWYRDYAVSPSL